jgi:hypothetical protein
LPGEQQEGWISGSKLGRNCQQQSGIPEKPDTCSDKDGQGYPEQLKTGDVDIPGRRLVATLKQPEYFQVQVPEPPELGAIASAWPASSADSAATNKATGPKNWSLKSRVM